MAVAKRQERENSAKIEQRKFRGSESGPQVKQTAFLASPIYIGQARVGGKKTYKKRNQGARAPLSSSLWVNRPSRLKDVFSCYFLNKIEL